MLTIFRVEAIDTSTMIPEGPGVAMAFLRAKLEGYEDVYGIVARHEEDPDCPGHVVFIGGTKEHTEQELLDGAADVSERVLSGEDNALAEAGAMYVDPRDGSLRTFGEPVA